MPDRLWVGDIEADGFLNTARIVWCGVFKNYDTGEVRKFHPGSHPDYIKAMLQFLDSETDVLALHNGIGYDLPLLRKLYNYRYKGKKIDTLLISRAQNPDRRSPPHCPNKYAPHSVEAWGYRLGRAKPEHEEWHRYSEEMLHRCTEDVEIQCGILRALIQEGAGRSWREAHKLNVELFECLQQSEEYGWTVDREHMRRVVDKITHWVERIDRVVAPNLPLILEIQETKKEGEYGYVRKPFLKNGDYSSSVVSWLSSIDHDVQCFMGVGGPFSRICFRPVSLDSNKETKEFLLKEGWEPKEWNTNDEGGRTSPKLSKDDPFIGINGKLGRLIAKRVQCLHRRSTIVGWFALIREDGRIPSKVNGLTYTYRAKHNNIVNIPRVSSFLGKDMRRTFVAREGWVLVGTDSDANHARQLAARMGDPEFIFAVTQGRKEDGTDMHSVNQRKIGPACKTRDDSKIFFYSFLLGAMPKRLSKVLKCSVDTAGEARQNFLDNLPALKAVDDGLKEEWRSHATRRFNPKYNSVEYTDGWFRGLDGRPVFCKFEKDVLGYALQSDEAIQMAKAYVQFHKWMEKTKYKYGRDWGMVNWYHDEFTFECRPELAKKLGKLAARAIVWAGEFYNIACPHKGNAQIGKNWSEIH